MIHGSFHAPVSLFNVTRHGFEFNKHQSSFGNTHKVDGSRVARHGVPNGILCVRDRDALFVQTTQDTLCKGRSVVPQFLALCFVAPTKSTFDFVFNLDASLLGRGFPKAVAPSSDTRGVC